MCSGSTYIPGGVCGKCLIPLKPKKNGFDMACYAANGYYFSISGDLWECPECKMSVVLGMNKPYHHSHEGIPSFSVDAVVQLEPHRMKKKSE